MIDKDGKLLNYCNNPKKIRDNSVKGYFLQRCNSRDRLTCDYCADLFQRDKNAIIISGCNSLDDDSLKVINDSNFYTLTLTAPSFGAVYGKHDKVDKSLIGVAKDLRRYNYKGQVSWNAHANELFRRSMKYLKDSYKSSVEFITIREWQARGAIHFHILFRVNKNEDSRFNFVRHLKKVNSFSMKEFKWGRQAVIEAIAYEKLETVSRYYSKVLTISSRQHGNEYRLLDPLAIKFYEKLNYAAFSLFCKCKLDEVDCRCTSSKNFGWTGHLITFSTGWSLNDIDLKGLEAERKLWFDSQSDKTASIEAIEEWMEKKYEENRKLYSDIVANPEVAQARVDSLLDSYSFIFES